MFIYYRTILLLCLLQTTIISRSLLPIITITPEKPYRLNIISNIKYRPLAVDPIHKGSVKITCRRMNPRERQECTVELKEDYHPGIIALMKKSAQHPFKVIRHLHLPKHNE